MGQSATKSIPIPPTPTADATSLPQLKQSDPTLYNILSTKQDTNVAIDTVFLANYADPVKPIDIPAAAIRTYAAKHNDYELFAQYRDEICKRNNLTDFIDPFVADPTIDAEFKVDRVQDLYYSNLAVIINQAAKAPDSNKFADLLNYLAGEYIALPGSMASKIVPNLTDDQLATLVKHNICGSDMLHAIRVENDKRREAEEAAAEVKMAKIDSEEKAKVEELAKKAANDPTNTAAAIELLAAVANAETN